LLAVENKQVVRLFLVYAIPDSIHKVVSMPVFIQPLRGCQAQTFFTPRFTPGAIHIQALKAWNTGFAALFCATLYFRNKNGILLEMKITQLLLSA
jgi:hypothetical protein